MRRLSLWFAVFVALAACAAGAWAQTQGPDPGDDPATIEDGQADTANAAFGRFPPIAHVFRVPKPGHQERRLALFLGLDDRQRAAVHDLMEQFYRNTRPIADKRREAFRGLLRTLAPNYDQERPTFGEVAARINALETDILNNELRFWADVKALLNDQQQERRFFLLFEGRILGPV
jgi:hypothetical protein